MRRESDLKRDYRPTWGFWEGVREVIQNGKDASVEHGATFEVTHRGNTLLVLNEGCVLDREAMLFGHSSKMGRDDLIGQFGDGLKVGMLALVRSGHSAIVRTGGETWIPRIERSKDFKADVLVWNFKDAPYQHRVLVEITCSPHEWEAIRRRFLFLRKPHPNNVKTNYGTLLGDPGDDGHLFAKGIWVCQDPELQNGYDAPFKVDIDRKMVNDWDARWHIAHIAAHAATRKEHVDRILVQIEDGAKDVSAITRLADIPAQLLDRAAERFVERFGSLAVPVASTQESAQAEHFGRRGICVNEVMLKLLHERLPSLDKVATSLENRLTRQYSWSDLTDAERANYESARDLLRAAGVEEIDGVKLNVVDFNDAATLGLHEEGKVYVARSQFATRALATETMVHECAHERGGADGTHSHVSNIEAIWSRIVEHLRG